MGLIGSVPAKSNEVEDEPQINVVLTPPEHEEHEGHEHDEGDEIDDCFSSNLAYTEGKFCLRHSREVIYSQSETLLEAGLEDLEIEEKKKNKDMADYCLLLLSAHFQGQTTKHCHKNTDGDETDDTDVLNLGNSLSMLDKYIRKFKQPTDFKGTEKDYKMLLLLVARKRHRHDAGQSEEECQEQLLEQSKRFVQIYHKRGVVSEELQTQNYWGTKQQLLAGKVIADYVDKENGYLDPIFGVLLQPTAGRVGPGDSTWVHGMLFDDCGHMAFHSAVHDAFGYLWNFHQKGPGYDYMKGSTWFSTYNPLAGQTPGIAFWKGAFDDISKKQKVLKHWML